MAQHDYNIANGGGAAVRSDINDALQAIITQNSGPNEPTVTRPYMLWNDTTAGALKIRNATDTAWVLYSAFTLPDDAVTAAKIAAGAVGTSEIADSAVTNSKIANMAITAAKLSGGQSGSAPVYAARSWVNFDGTGTVGIRASGNVMSITDNGVGDYTVNFALAMPSVNFSVTGTAGSNEALTSTAGRLLGEFGMSARTTSSCRVTTALVNHLLDSTELADSSVVSVAIFG